MGEAQREKVTRLSPLSPPVNQSEDKQQNNRADGCADDGRDNARTEVDAQAWQEPTSDQSPENADGNIGDETEACPFDDLASEPSRDKADHQDDE
jgi:hypothetical protein